MGLDVVVRCGDKEMSLCLTANEVKAFRDLTHHCPDELLTLIAITGSYSGVLRMSDAPTEALGTLIDLLTDQPEVLPYCYHLEVCSDKPYPQSGDSGLQLPDDDGRYYITTGYDECSLKTMPSVYHEQKNIDIRGSEDIQTVNMGKILIRRERLEGAMVGALSRISAFMEDCFISNADSEVTLTSTHSDTAHTRKAT